jgi:Amt family ammonium transporter
MNGRLQLSSLLILIVFICLLPEMASAQTRKFALQSDLDHVWTMTAAALVFLMQAGFLILEAGSVRSKNSINVAHKNLMDFAMSSLCFGLIGFALMFGTSYGGVIGFSSDYAVFAFEGDWTLTFFVFQMMFCGTAATIVSGAVAERASMVGYIWITLAIRLFIYPVVGHWAWGGLLNGSETPWLASLGFMDFAGSSVVHSVGAWVALAAVIIIGPRIERFDENGKPNKMHGHSPILATCGALILWVGWIGFNGGSTTAGTGDFAQIVTNTMIAGAAGAVTQTLIGLSRSGLHRPEWLINGSLSGLVAITAGCDAVSTQSAFLIGSSGSIICFFSARFLVGLRIDDPLGAISVHGFAGAWGTIMTAVFAREEMLLAGNRLDQIGVQVLGVLVIFAWAFGVSFILLKVINEVVISTGGPHRGLRVSEADEREGLNMSEHDSPLGNTGLVRAMVAILKDPEAGIEPIAVEPGEESFEAAMLFNQIAERIRDRAGREKELLQTTSNLILADLRKTMAEIQNGNLQARMTGTVEGPFATVPSDVNAMILSIEQMVEDVRRSTDIVSTTSDHLLQQSGLLATDQQLQAETLSRLADEMVALRERSDQNATRLGEALSNAALADTDMKKATAVSQAALEMIKRSSVAVDRIVEAASLIDEVAFETRLLSLNASVEAARAEGVGDRNMAGFAVVAQEVRSLADTTSKTASDISQIVEEVQNDTQNAVGSVIGTDEALNAARRRIEANTALMKEVSEIEVSARQALSDVEQELLKLRRTSEQNLTKVQETNDAVETLQTSAAESTNLLSRFANDGDDKKQAA